MKILVLCLFLLSSLCLGKLVDDPDCTINGGKLCAAAGCCYDNGQVIIFILITIIIITIIKITMTGLVLLLRQEALRCNRG